MEKVQTTQRNSQLELLRILCMLMIVAYHYSIYGFYSDTLLSSPNKTLIELVGLGGNIGASIFILISGYYMLDSRYSFRKFSLYLGQIWFYTLGALLLFLLVFPDSGLVDRSMISMALFPISKGHYWFATSYFVLMLFSPFLNVFIRSASRSQLLAAIWTLLGIFVFLPLLFNVYLTYSTIARLLILYLTAGYIRLYGTGSPTGFRRHLMAALTLAAGAVLWVVLANLLGQKLNNSYLLEHSTVPAHNALFVYLMALALFLVFSKATPRYSKWINQIAKLTFGVYLFHENQLLRSIWQSIFKTAQFVDSPWLLLHALCAISTVYLAGSLVEYLRQKTVGRLWEGLTDRFFLPAWNRLTGFVHGQLRRCGIE
ncbi:MAG: acyltransferase [Candidatus Limivicinus sp.]